MALHTLLPTLSSSLSLAGVSLLLYWVSIQLSRYLNPLRKLPYPPGPPPRDFILGNARDLLSSPLWFTFTDWAAKYGSINHLKALDMHIVVLNSVDDAVELLEKRSNIYSDRPSIPMMDLVGGTFATPLKRYGPVWQVHRRHFQQMFRPAASLGYRPIQVEKVNNMLCGLLESPEDFATHIKTLSAAIILVTMYGYEVSPKDDPLQAIAEDAMTSMSEIAYPGASIINILPMLRLLPTWFPGAKFHHVARVIKPKVRNLQDVPYKYVQDTLAEGTASSSLVASVIETCKTKDDHINLKEMAATGYGAGVDTTTSTIMSFIHAMAQFPHVQKKAQEELDRVVGTDRLANFDDQASLPYIQAVFREALRWRPVFPLGISHANTADDVYNGYYIPARTTIIPNTWGMSRDPTKYKDAEEFNPDRFFNENNELNNDDVAYVFGFGRRFCPGRHMASATVWLAIATILATFDIRPPKDASGQDIPLDVCYTSAVISHALPFECAITPRSAHAKQLIVDLRSNIN